jgi:hypothetical protein
MTLALVCTAEPAASRTATGQLDERGQARQSAPHRQEPEDRLAKNNVQCSIAATFSSRKRDGYMKSQIDQFPKYFPGNSRSLLSNFDQHDIDSDSVRTGLRFLPSDRLEINLTANYSTVDQAGPTRKTAGLYYTPDAALLPNYENAIHDNLVEDPGF